MCRKCLIQQNWFYLIFLTLSQEAQSNTYSRDAGHKHKGVIYEVAAQMCGGENQLKSAIAAGRVKEVGDGEDFFYHFKSMYGKEGNEFKQGHKTTASMDLDLRTYQNISGGLGGQLNMGAPLSIEDLGASSASSRETPLSVADRKPDAPDRSTHNALAELSVDVASLIKDNVDKRYRYRKISI